MAGIEAEPGKIGRHVGRDPVELVLELDVAASMRVDDGADAMAVASEFGDGADVRDHAGPGVGIEARRAVGMAGGVVALVVAPVHHRQVRRRVALALVAARSRQRGDERADLVGLAQEVLPVPRVHQVVEDGAGDDAQAAGIQGGADAAHIERHVAVGAELEPAEARRGGLVEHALPRRQVRVLHVVDAPAAGRAGDGDGEDLRARH